VFITDTGLPGLLDSDIGQDHWICYTKKALFAPVKNSDLYNRPVILLLHRRKFTMQWG